MLAWLEEERWRIGSRANITYVILVVYEMSSVIWVSYLTSGSAAI